MSTSNVIKYNVLYTYSFNRIFNVPNCTTTFWDLVCRKGNLDLSYYILEISCQHYYTGKCICTCKPSKSLWSHQPTITCSCNAPIHASKTGFTLINIDAQDMKLWNSYLMRMWSSESCQAIMKQSPQSYKT